MNTIILYSDDSRGIYIPKHFAESIHREYVQGIDLDHLDYLADSDNLTDDGYWDVWQDVLDNCRLVKDGKAYTLYQDGCLWLLDLDNMTNDEYLEFFGEERE